MSFSADIKEELSKVNNLNDKEALKAEFLGYLLTWKINNTEGNIEFLTENEFNVERFYKILFNLGLNYEPETYGKFFKTTIFQNEINFICPYRGGHLYQETCFFGESRT